MSVGVIIFIVLILLLVGGYGGWIGGPWYGGSPHYVGGDLGTVLVIIFILMLLGRL